MAATFVTPLEMQNNASKQPEVDPFEECIVMHIVYSNSFIKSQQKDEPELSVEDKIACLVHLLKDKPAVFLDRFGRLLSKDHLTYFDCFDDPDVQRRLEWLCGCAGAKQRKATVKNRRYVHMQRLMEKETYFSEEEMRMRNPLLYEYYIGQYLTSDERQALDRQSAEVLLSARLLQRVDRDACADRLTRQLKEEEDQTEETDSDESEYVSEDDKDTDEEERVTFSPDSPTARVRGTENIKLSSDPNLASREKRMLKIEFLQFMQQQFLSGKDETFDYSTVDNDASLDLSSIQDLDEQDAYFDAEEPTSVTVVDPVNEPVHICNPLGVVNTAHVTTPITDTPITDTPFTDTPITDTPITDTPITDTHITDTATGTQTASAMEQTGPGAEVHISSGSPDPLTSGVQPVSEATPQVQCTTSSMQTEDMETGTYSTYNT